MDVTDPYAAPEGFAQRSVDVDGFSIRYVDGGEGYPIVFLHGAGGPDLGAAHALLAKDFRVIAIELPGFGDSPVNTVTRDAREMATTLRRVAAAIGLESYALLGTSMGGVVALWWATETPDEVTALVLEAPAALRLVEMDPAKLADWDAFVDAFHARPERKPWLEERVLPTLRDPGLVARLMGPARDEALVERLRVLPVPVLVMYGTRDGLFPPAQGREYKRVLPECVFTLVHGAAHDIKGDRPEAFAELVRDFVGEGSFLINHRSSVLNP